MKKTAIACAFFFLSFHATAQTYLSCDFENGIPNSFVLKDYDGNTPSEAMAREGFSVGTPWIAVAPDKGKSNHAAASTSWYNPAGTSDDWMITPPLTLTGSHPQLQWTAKSSDKKHRDGYEVYISTNGGTEKADFNTASPLFSTAAEENSWTTHTLSLEAYSGQTVRIAFVNNSSDCSRLYVDNLLVEEYHLLGCDLDLGNFINYSGPITLSGTASTISETPIDGFTIGVEAAGETTTQHFNDQLSAAQPVAFTLDRKLNIGKHEALSYKVWIEANGNQYVLDRQVKSYPRKAVCEEGTGTWCGWCVRGIVALDSIKKHYADRIIGIAAHSGDVMASDYITNVSQYFGNGYPTGNVNRTKVCDPEDFISNCNIQMKAAVPYSYMTLDLDFDRTTRCVTTNTTLYFAEDMNNQQLALAYAIIENNVHQPGNKKYQQHNSYANGENGPMGGYEQYGEYIPSEVMYFNDVARGFVDDLSGIDGTVPADITADQPVTDNRSFILPNNILVDDNVEIVALLIDKASGHIINGEQTALVPPSPDGINPVPTSSSDTPIAVYDVQGRCHDTLQKGLNILRTADGRIHKICRR